MNISKCAANLIDIQNTFILLFLFWVSLIFNSSEKKQQPC